MNVLAEHPMTEKQSRYLSYLLRLWQTGEGGERAWRASLESPGTRRRRGFASLETLFDFLKSQTEFEALDRQDSVQETLKGDTHNEKGTNSSRSRSDPGIDPGPTN
jgi:hypothetical protein